MATRKNPSARADVEVHQDGLTYAVSADEPLSEAVITALRAAVDGNALSERGTDPRGGEMLTPLYETIDPDALSALFDSNDGDGVRTGGITFTHDGYQVTATVAGAAVVSVTE